MFACAVFSLALCTLNITGRLPVVSKPLQRLIAVSSERLLTHRVQHSLRQPLLASMHLIIENEIGMGGLDASRKTQLKHEEGVDVADKYGRTPLMKAAGRGNLERVRTLLESGAEVNAVDADGRTPLMIIAAWGRMETVQHLTITKMLLQYGAEVNVTAKRGHTPLMAAAQWGARGL